VSKGRDKYQLIAKKIRVCEVCGCVCTPEEYYGASGCRECKKKDIVIPLSIPEEITLSDDV